MNWFQKLAGRTFALVGSEKISRPKNIDDLGNELQRFASEKSGSYIDISTISSDGDSLGQDTGIINWYITNEVTEEQRKQIIQAWIQEMELLDYQIKVTGPEVSGMSGMFLKTHPAASSGSTLMVYRIHVLKNGSLDFTKIPTISINSVNAIALMESLGITEENGVGSIDLNELKTKLEMFNSWEQEQLIREPQGNAEQGMIDYGYTEDQASRHISTLTQMVDFGLRNGFTQLQWY